MNTTPRTRTARSTVAASALAAAVLVGGVAGSATAAKLITGKDIKNNTVASADIKNNGVTGADIKNGSIGTADLAESARPTLRWNAETATTLETCGPLPIACNLVTISGVGVGQYLVTANFNVVNDAVTPSQNTICMLVRNNAPVAVTRMIVAGKPNNGFTEAASLQARIDSTETNLPVSLRCTEANGDSLVVENATLSVLQVTPAG